MATLIEEIQLDNNLRLELWDVSRTIAGDRWLVRLEARINVPLDNRYFESSENGDRHLSLFEEEYGRQIPFVHEEEKHFVDKKDKDRVFNQLLKFFRDNTEPYLSHKAFADRFIMSRLRELKQKKPQLFL